VVQFIVDFTTIAARNAERTDKKIDIDVLERKQQETQDVDPEFEDIDEMLFVREDI